MFSHLTPRMTKALRLFIIAALLGGLALSLGVVLVAQAAVSLTVTQPPEPTSLTLLPDQATNLLPTDTSHQFTAAVLSQYGTPMAGVVVSFSTDFGQFDGGVQYVEVQTDVLGVATVTITSTTVGTANIRAWIDGNSDDTYSTGELTDDPSTKTWQVEIEGTGTIVLEKKTDPSGGSGFNFIKDFGIPGFSLDDGMTLTIPYVPSGTYSVTEADPIPFGFDLTGLTCEDPDEGSSIDLAARTATIDLDAGETITCTFNNAERGTIVIRKQSDPPGGSGFNFINNFGIPGFSLDDGMTLTIPYVPSGIYSVTEADPIPFGFDLTGLTCEDPDGESSIDLAARTATIDLDAGETITCTFTNSALPGSITVVKQVVGDAPADDWSFSGDLGAFTLPAAGGQQLFTDQAAADYTITETSKDGYAASVTCDSGESGSNSVTVNLDPGEDVICTFTNSALPGSITVVKQVVGDAPADDWSFSGDLGAFTLPAAGGQQLFTDQAAADYTITETSKDGYAASVVCDSGEDGNNSVTVNLDPGEDVICTFTNSALPGSITVVKQVVGDAPADDWSFSGDLGAFTLPAAGGQQLFTDQAASDYTITETSKDGYAVSVTCDSGEDGSNSVTVNLDPGEDVICTFTNSALPGSITVVKQVVGDAPADDWSFSGDLGAFTLPAAGGQQLFTDQAADDYTITETSKDGYAASVVCDSGEDGSNSVTVNLDPGEDVICTFTNSALPGSITVVKQVVGDAPADDWSFSGDLGAFTLPAAGGQQLFTDQAASDYTITETSKDGYAASVTCDSGESGSNSVTVNLDPGEDVICTFTNSALPGSITVVKQVVGDAPADDWSFSGDLGAFTLPAAGGQQLFTDQAADDYTITETSKDGYAASVTCDSGESGSNSVTVNLDPGEDVICTFTNSALPGSITVVKQVVGDAPADDWSFSGDLGAFTLPAAGGQQLFTDQAADDYTITETSKDGYAASVVCDSGEDGSNSVTVNLDPGEDVICTFTNSALPGSITVVKQVVGDAPADDWSFSGDLGAFTLPAAGGQQLFSDQAASDYTITETSKDGYAASVVCDSGEDGSNSVTVNLDPGEDVTCTFTNTRQGGTIIVEKQTDPAGDQTSFTFTGDAAGTISDGGQIVVADLLPGTYTATEVDPGQDFDLTSITCDDDNSTGDVGTRTATFNLEAGETVKCTFTNHLQAGTIIVEKQTSPDGSWGSFTFSGDAAGTISDNGQIVVGDLSPGTYTATEADPGQDFDLTAITCDDGNSSGNVGTRTATFNLEADETVKCTFSNARRSLQVSKELELPVGGLAAVGQIVRFNITIENNGGLTIDPLTLRDDYDSWCLRSRRAEVPPDLHGGSLGFLQWNDLGALPPGETKTLWVEFTAAHGCEEATNRATVETGGLTFEDEATVRILETIARVGGFFFHDDNGNGALDLPCRGTDVDPATCEPGLEEATAETTLPSGSFLRYITNTSGWYSFNLLDPGTYHVEASAPGGSWWTPTTAEECDATVVNNWDQLFCHFGYWWGLDGPPLQAAALRQAQDAAVAGQEMTFRPTQDATISDWNGANKGHNEHLRVRQPGVTSALLQFDLSGLPEGAEVVWAKLRLYSPFASNGTNRLYMTAYPLETMWTEDGATWLQAATGVPWDAAGATGDHGDPVGWAWIDAPGWVEFDLNSDLLAGWLADPVGNHGLLLRGEGSGNREVAYWFFSREYLNADVQPQLVVGYDVP